MTDPVNGVEAVMRATPNHPVVVVYTHAGAESVCFELAPVGGLDASLDRPAQLLGDDQHAHLSLHEGR